MIACRRLALAVLATTLCLTGCLSLPPQHARTDSHAMAATADTRLGKAMATSVAEHPGQTGLHLLDLPRDAFATLMQLARAADRSLDVQYYIWQADTSGYLMLAELQAAAERGVRVRLLLDDNGIVGLDRPLAVLDQHPNIEVRLFNPFVQRRFKYLGFLTDFNRLNRRMHNKSFTVDGEVTITGGRNIGDTYFSQFSDLLYSDLDLLAIGPVVKQVSAAFDAYWNSQSAYPARAIVGAVQAGDIEALQSQIAEARDSSTAKEYLDTLNNSALFGELTAGKLPMVWTTARLIYDPPDKVLGGVPADQLIVSELRTMILGAAREVDLVSPYFVPGRAGAAALAGLSTGGVRVRIVTNSLASTDVPAAFSQYFGRREGLIRNGVLLYEMKPEVSGNVMSPRSRRPPAMLRGSSSASLHAKSFTIDRERVFIGSFNLDQRSAWLNTEMGLVIESPRLASILTRRLDASLHDHTYQLALAVDANGVERVEWLDLSGGGEARLTSEPGASGARRVGAWFLSWLPIEWLM